MGAIADNTKMKRLHMEKFHRNRGAKLLPFAGYLMPIHYPSGIISEHLHSRQKVALFDISHMGQAYVSGAHAIQAMESLVPGDISGLALGKMRYTQLTNESGGILDDLMVTNFGDHLLIVVNAAVKDLDFSHIRKKIKNSANLQVINDRAFLALQGPLSEKILKKIFPGVEELIFLSASQFSFRNATCYVSRSGYSGEDGFEISVPHEVASELFSLIEGQPEVIIAGLGARDSLRLEAGLCLYGSELNQHITPVEAGLEWSIGKKRLEVGNFPGASVILDQIKNGTNRKRVGVRITGGAIARANTEIQSVSGKNIGFVTSGGFGPSINGPIAMGYVDREFSKKNSDVRLSIRSSLHAGKIELLPFIKHRYVK